MRSGPRRSRLSVLSCALLLLASVAVFGCTTTTETTSIPVGSKTDKSAGFFSRMMDQLTTRECLVAGFACPYGFGPANEPCDCTDPSGRVLNGRTIK